MTTVEVAIELRRRGHDVAVYSPRVGDLAKPALANGVWVKSRLGEIPWEPEIIHGQHHLQTVTALTFFEKTPAIYYCHGGAPWVEKPPLHRRIRQYAVMCPRMVLRAGPEFGVSSDRVTAIPNFVNTHRFSRVRPPREKPRRALLFGNMKFAAEERLRLEATCAGEGIALDYAGSAFGNRKPRPETFLPDYDLVFGIGKCAIEAMACGCAVIPLLPGLAGRLITPENFSKWAFSNFSPRYFTAAEAIDPGWLREELSRYSPANIAQTTAKLRAEHTLEIAVDRLEALYQKALCEHAALPTAPDARELALYLETMTPAIDVLWADFARFETLQSRCCELESEMNLLRLKNEALQSRVDDLRRDWRQSLSRLQKKLPGRKSLRNFRHFLRRILFGRGTKTVAREFQPS